MVFDREEYILIVLSVISVVGVHELSHRYLDISFLNQIEFLMSVSIILGVLTIVGTYLNIGVRKAWTGFSVKDHAIVAISTLSIIGVHELTHMYLDGFDYLTEVMYVSVSLSIATVIGVAINAHYYHKKTIDI